MIKFDLSLIDDVDIDGIDMRDYPDFCDAFLVGASYKGRELTEDELEYVQDSNPEWFYDQVWDTIH
tara:strand:- start:650 stop:847 length:198 start_codon:yes stop_codon:yes gene_type:complete